MNEACRRCGLCCVVNRVVDADLRFYKPRFVRCEHLAYEGDITRCKLHGTTQQPKTCRKHGAPNCRGFKRNEQLWFIYRRNDFVEHKLWLREHGYLAGHRVMDMLRLCDYSRPKAFLCLVVMPHILSPAGTAAASHDWFKRWDIKNFMDNMPPEYEQEVFRRVKRKCDSIYFCYRRRRIPEHWRKAFDICLNEYPKGRWIPFLRYQLWEHKDGKHKE